MVEGISIWVPVISTLTGGVLAGGVALLVSRMNHRYALEREAIAAKGRQLHEFSIANDKKEEELRFLASELVFLLEQFAEACAGVATDHGYSNQDKTTIPETTVPNLSYSTVTGDWRVLPAKLMYRIRELPVIQGEADRSINAADVTNGAKLIHPSG